MSLQSKSVMHAADRVGAGLSSARTALLRILERGGLDRRMFVRGHSVGPYVLELCCPTENLVIELVASKQAGKGAVEHDPRAGFLRSLGLQIVQIDGREVFRNPEGVVALIRR